MNKKDFAQMFDHSVLKPNATPADITAGCKLARDLGLGLMMVQPWYVDISRKYLEGAGVLVGTVISFPHGCDLPEVKAFSAKTLHSMGAHDLDMVINIGAMKAGQYEYVEADVRSVVEAAPGAVVKVILETSYLTPEEIVAACQICVRAGAHFVKTSTGFSDKGAAAADVALMRKTVGPNIGVKASGGIRTLEQALAMVKAGANRLGVSASQAILKEWDGRDD